MTTNCASAYVRQVFRLFTACLLAITAMIIASQYGMAQSVGFMPGDAFFTFTLNETLVESLSPADGEAELSYAMKLYDLGGLFAGFQRLRLVDVPPQLVEDLRRVYRDHRKYVHKIVSKHIAADGSVCETELNAPLAFVYNRDADWRDQEIALKYNEDWPNLPESAFVGRDRGLTNTTRVICYEPLMRTYDAVVADWAGARKFRGLEVRIPKDTAWGIWGKRIEEPVIAEAKDVQVLVMADADLEKYFLRDHEPYFYQVDPNGITVCYWEEGDKGNELVEKTWKDWTDK